MPSAAPPERKDRHKKRHMAGLRPVVFELIERTAARNSRPVSWEIELAIAYYVEHCMGMQIPNGVRRLMDSHDED